MLVSIDWIKNFVQLPELSPDEIMKRFTMATAEVESVTQIGAHLKSIIIAEIIQIEKHPEADLLKLVRFKIGPTDNRQVVCGAPNVEIGMKVPFAPLGTTFPNGMTLVPKKIRGVLSEGMLCSEQELGFAEKSDGLMKLATHAPVGQSLAEFFQVKEDVILDIDNKSLTHRPDLWGIFGMAREFATVYDLPLNNTFDEKWKQGLQGQMGKEESPVKVEVKKNSAGVAYYGLSLSGIEVKESPHWLKARLQSVGLRPINNIVDISNYVMFELGMPLHIFDRDQIQGGKVVIKSLDASEKFVTLDEVERVLEVGDTVICDSTGPLVLAGIMGGLKSGVSEKTKNIFIEVANWRPSAIRRTSVRLGLRSDSSQRYEKSLDSALLERTMFRTLELIMQECSQAKVVGGLEYDGDKFWEAKPLVINTSVSKIATVLGKDLTRESVERIFVHLGFGVHFMDQDCFSVSVPSWRATKDIEFEADLIEEIGRIIGYDNIKEQSPALDIRPVRLSQTQALHRKIKDFFVLSGGAFEMMTYPMIGEKLIQDCQCTDSSIPVLNYLSEDHSRMRSSLLPSLLEMVIKNQKHVGTFKIFELGRTYHRDNKNFAREENHLGVVYYNKTENLFLEIANMVEKLFVHLGFPFEFQERGIHKSSVFENEEWKGCHPYEYLNVRLMGKMQGALTSVHPALLRQLKIKGNVAIFLVDLSVLEQREVKAKVNYKPLAKYPSSTFDWTVMLEKEKSVKDILDVIKMARIREMSTCEIVRIFDLNENYKTVTLRAVLTNPEKTLDSEFLEQTKSQLVEITEKAGFPLKIS